MVIRVVKIGILIGGLVVTTAEAYESTLTFGAGSRSETFDWSIGFGDTTPNILSELSWDKLEIREATIEYSKLVDEWFYLKAQARHGWIQDGRVQDSDYFGDGRTDEFSRSVSATDKGYTEDLSFGMGIPFQVEDIDIAPQITIIPMVGFSQNTQSYRIRKGQQIYPTTGTIPGLNSLYEAEWKGLWLGVDFFIRTGRRVSLFAQLERHNAKYNADANWNLRPEFAHPISFSHTADDAEGTVVALGYIYNFSQSFGYSVRIENQTWKSGKGVDTVFFADGSSQSTQLNNANWSNRRFELSLMYHF